ncbi:cilia- and flagella-associated protein 184 [Polymixia lowei]
MDEGADQKENDISPVNEYMELENESKKETQPDSSIEEDRAPTPGASNEKDGVRAEEMLALETPEGETTSPVQEEEEEEEEDSEEEATAAPPDETDIDSEEYVQLFHQLCAEREKSSQLNSQLQMKLAELFQKKTGDDAQPEKWRPASDQEQHYEKYMTILEDLERQYARNSAITQQQTEELKLQTQEKLGQVEGAWRVFAALKHDVAARAASRYLGKQAAQAKVDQVLVSEQQRESELVQVRLENIKLKNKTQEFEATLKGLQLLNFDQLGNQLELKEKIEKQNEELLKLRKKITNNMEVLTHVKEKLQWSQMESQAKQAQQAEVEGAVTSKRYLLTRSKQDRNRLRMDNLKLKEQCGLLGNNILLRDFEDKVDASGRLEEGLGSLSQQHVEVVLKCSRRKKKMMEED